MYDDTWRWMISLICCGRPIRSCYGTPPLIQYQAWIMATNHVYGPLLMKYDENLWTITTYYVWPWLVLYADHEQCNMKIDDGPRHRLMDADCRLRGWITTYDHGWWSQTTNNGWFVFATGYPSWTLVNVHRSWRHQKDDGAPSWITIPDHVYWKPVKSMIAGQDVWWLNVKTAWFFDSTAPRLVPARKDMRPQWLVANFTREFEWFRTN